MKKLFNEIKKRLFVTKEILLHGGYTELSILTTDLCDILENKKVIITGGGSGIGKCIAQVFVKHGAEVSIVGRDVQKLLKVQNELGEKVCHTITGDVSVESLEIYEKCKKAFGQTPDILINCAAIISPHGFETTTSEEFDKVMNINLKGTYF